MNMASGEGLRRAACPTSGRQSPWCYARAAGLIHAGSEEGFEYVLLMLLRRTSE